MKKRRGEKHEPEKTVSEQSKEEKKIEEDPNEFDNKPVVGKLGGFKQPE
jgi:hypothetical protein